MPGQGTRPVALVTGAAGGLGGAIAAALARRGFDLVLNDLAEGAALQAAGAAARDAGAEVRFQLQDIAAVEALPAFVEAAASPFGRLDCLINNAGVSVLSRGDVLDVAPESFDRCMSVNLRGQFFLAQAVARHMLAAPAGRKSIITVTSVAVDEVIGKVLAEYSIAKAGLSHMIKHFAVRLAPCGIDCYELRPGMMKTGMTASSREKYDGLIAAGFVPAGRWGELDEIGETAANLAAGALRYAVGQVIHVDGGMRLKVF
ncbi:3-ketoacyl-ACP reductase [Oleomonas cavernae]|uniref:3-ketoacyl-ACP reductase n=1 Tax=Oleomonas cavernae TaxID=2320859 RepID=A0A418WIH1_9PROT|nr:3-ketoacyl-ACP reductase [Oleomonas cavernae]RJF89847.1 3-ketoacyl-ACP reductase [Oleomonas cavernae]